jgi:hypothetical protein
MSWAFSCRSRVARKWHYGCYCSQPIARGHERKSQMTDERWELILAGGEGSRLRPMTLRIEGDDRPKQFCRVRGGATLLDQTRRRAAPVLPPDQTLIVVTRPHERFYASLLATAPAACVVVQPESRGTVPAILYGLLRVAAKAPTAAVALVPSDHYVSAAPPSWPTWTWPSRRWGRARTWSSCSGSSRTVPSQNTDGSSPGIRSRGDDGAASSVFGASGKSHTVPWRRGCSPAVDCGTPS